VASAAQEIERLRAEVIERELAVAACQREIADSRRQSAALRSWLDEVFRSHSWRWTSPLRKVYGWLLRG